MRVVIVGGGSLGTRAAGLLVRRGHDVVLVELDADTARSIGDVSEFGVIHGDGTRPAVLNETDPRHADALLALTSNSQTNLIASLIGRSVGFQRVITRIDDEEFEHVAIELGLSDTIVPGRTIGRYLADIAEGKDILDLSGAIKGDARVLLVVAREQDEVEVGELGLPTEARISHFYRDQALMFAAEGVPLRKGDEIVIVTHRKHFEELRKRWAPRVDGGGSG